MATIPTHSEIDDRPEALALLCAIKANLPMLEQLLLETEGTWGKADHFYRFYHQSYKVYRTQEMTLRIVGALQSLLPDRPLNTWFSEILKEGTGVTFSTAHNKIWLQRTRPILEAYFHAHSFLEMAILSGRTLDEPPNFLPNSWAAVLYLFNLR